MRRHYEQVIILKPTLTQEEINGRIEAVKENITKNGGEIVAFQDIGIKKLAYKVEKNPRGYYGVIYFTIEPSAIIELERVLKISEDVIKFLTLKYESKKELVAFNGMVDKANGKGAEAPKEESTEAKTEEVAEG
jgi:small subunit ribosomal protein S6